MESDSREGYIKIFLRIAKANGFYTFTFKDVGDQYDVSSAMALADEEQLNLICTEMIEDIEEKIDTHASILKMGGQIDDIIK